MKLTYISALSIGLLCLSAALINGKKSNKTIEKQFQYVPAGNVIVESDTLSVQAFKMLDHEVTNFEYREFLSSIKREKPELLEKLQVNDNGWSEHYKNSYLKPMDKLYSKHEAYNSYPVVNISQFAAKEYCKWLTKILNKDLDEKINVRLPTRAEFIRAGAGSNLGAQYSWGNNQMQNAKGTWLCNFTRVSQTQLTRGEDGFEVIEVDYGDRYTKKEAMLTAKTKSYFPSQFEIYNLNGNVAEWLVDEKLAAGGSWYDFGYDVRLQSIKKEESPSPEVGFRPVFTVIGDQ